MLTRVRRVAHAGEHPRHLADPRVVEDELGARDRASAGADLGHCDLRVSERRDLREMGDAQHLVPTSQRGQRPPDRTPGFSTDAGVDLVEHERGRRDREHDA